MWESAQARREFLDYFQRHGHTVVPSSSLVPQNDPTLLFTNAGMNQFKEVFTGRETRAYRRAAGAQKCVRAGGKHNDLENVGRTARHNTFFEMLGNFSFGDYFKEQAIVLAWELLTRGFGIPGDRLMVTVFGGDGQLGLGPDQEARSLWQRAAGLPDHRILALGVKDNFWQMGDTGPCGPCSEIHYHQGDDLPCPETRCKGAACDCDRWVEIWNLVFMQFERDGGSLTALPAPSVDTGMGLERLTAVLQGVRSNFETDLFTPIIEEIVGISDTRFDPTDYTGPSASIRAIADHARATAFLIADGVLPEKTGREYVLRRIMRRAIYHGWLLGIQEPFLHRLAGVVIDRMKDVYPELGARRSTTVEMTQLEEIKFRETLDRGLRILEDEFATMSRSPTQVPGDVAFRLYDTFGFPLDLTQVIAEDRGYGVDVGGYEAAMAEQRRRSTFAGSGDESVDRVLLAIRAEVGPTEFLGYDTLEADATVLRVIVAGEEVPSAREGPLAFVTDRTPFYGEQGGQVGDTGYAVASDGARCRVTDARRPSGDLTVHIGELAAGELRPGDRVHLVVDGERRDAIRKNHSATHLLHWALREVLGDHVAQRGSVVAPDRLRFDFSHTRPLSLEEQRRVEALVNERIWRNEAVGTDVMDIEEAWRSGALAFFGEKYGERVRVVQMAESREFCGGTHVARTGDVGQFKIVDESGIAQGIRRIVAVTGTGSLQHVQELEDILSQVAERLRASGGEIIEKVDRLQEETRAMQRQIEDLQRRIASGAARDLMEDLRDVGGIKVLAIRAAVGDVRALRSVGDELRGRLGSGVLVLAGVENGKVTLMGMVTPDLTDRVQANRIIEEIALVVGGRGGGRPELAQGGGTRPEMVGAALSRVYDLVRDWGLGTGG